MFIKDVILVNCKQQLLSDKEHVFVFDFYYMSKRFKGLLKIYFQLFKNQVNVKLNACSLLLLPCPSVIYIALNSIPNLCIQSVLIGSLWC